MRFEPYAIPELCRFIGVKLIFRNNSYIVKPMSALKNRTHILYIPFLLYFATYAVSPLSFTYSENSGARIRGDARSAGDSLHIYILELIFKEISPGSGDDKNTDGFRVLLRKLRAVLSKSSAVDGMGPADAAARAIAGPVPVRLPSCIMGHDGAEKTSSGYYPLHSGPSPPGQALVS